MKILKLKRILIPQTKNWNFKEPQDLVRWLGQDKFWMLFLNKIVVFWQLLILKFTNLARTLLFFRSNYKPCFFFTNLAYKPCYKPWIYKPCLQTLLFFRSLNAPCWLLVYNICGFNFQILKLKLNFSIGNLNWKYQDSQQQRAPVKAAAHFAILKSLLLILYAFTAYC